MKCGRLASKTPFPCTNTRHQLSNTKQTQMDETGDSKKYDLADRTLAFVQKSS